jgi:hypothetical protein
MAQIIDRTAAAPVGRLGPWNYVEYGPRETIPPPFISKGGSFLGLGLQGDMAAIQNLCDKVLNTPAQGTVKYKPLTHYVILLVGSFAQLRSEIYPSKGYVPETQLSLWVPLEETVGSHLCLTAPFIFIDNPMSLLSGRDDFGYPKALGQFTPTAWEKSGIGLDVYGGDFGQNNIPRWCELLKITQASVSPAVPPPDETPQEVAEKLGHLAQQESGGSASLLSAVAKFVEELIKGQVKQTFLKQFRDVASSSDACYQKLVEAVAKVENVHPHISPVEWQVDLVELASHPVVEELGLKKSEKTRLAFEAEMDVILELGQVVAP